MSTVRLWLFLGLVLVVATGCAVRSAPLTPTRAATLIPPTVPRPSPTPMPTLERPLPSDAPTPTATTTPAHQESLPLGVRYEFNTDWSKHSVPYEEILSGGPPKDGIPAIDRPQFVSVDEADAWLKPQEPVILFELNGEARVYPIQILIWHEIVNDVVGGEPVVITFCPLCNTAIAFERRVGDQVLDFGTTGRLRYSNLIMYDRQTESWWQQATGDAIVGTLTGTRLRFLPASIVAWQTFKERYPQGSVLSRNTGYNRPYGQNPYTGYDNVNSTPFLYEGPETPDKLPPMARVLTLDLNGEAVAYPYRVLARVHVVNDTVGGQPVVVFWQPGVASPLDQVAVAAGKDVGTAAAFSRRVGDQVLTFVYRDGEIQDAETGSTWNVLGEATSGPLAGTTLQPVVSINHFWFSWAAFRPQTRIYK